MLVMLHPKRGKTRSKGFANHPDSRILSPTRPSECQALPKLGRLPTLFGEASLAKKAVALLADCTGLVRCSCAPAHEFFSTTRLPQTMGRYGKSVDPFVASRAKVHRPDTLRPITRYNCG